MDRRPHIAIIDDNTLTALGLRGLLETMMPMAEISVFDTAEAMHRYGDEQFFHFFVTAKALLADVPFFMRHSKRTIVLVQHAEASLLPAHFHTLDVTAGEDKLVRAIMTMQQHGHAGKEVPHAAHPHARMPHTVTTLTPREIEVLRLVVQGKLNKEIASTLNIGLSTVISHRKNLTEKLGIKSVSALTIYAVTHGLISLEEQMSGSVRP